MEVTGSPEGFALSRSLTRARGTLVLKSTFAENVSVNLSKLVVDEVTLVGSRCGNYPAGLRALSSGLIQVGDMVDSIFSLEQGLRQSTVLDIRGFKSPDQTLKAHYSKIDLTRMDRALSVRWGPDAGSEASGTCCDRYHPVNPAKWMD